MRRPFEVDDTVNLDGFFTEEHHGWGFVDLDGIPGDHARDVVVVGGPLENGPGDLLARHLDQVLVRVIDSGKGAQQIASLDVPDDKRLAVLVGGEREVWRRVLGDDDGPVGPGDDVAFAGREIDQIDERVRKAHDAFPGRPAP